MKNTNNLIKGLEDLSVGHLSFKPKPKSTPFPECLPSCLSDYTSNKQVSVKLKKRNNNGHAKMNLSSPL